MKHQYKTKAAGFTLVEMVIAISLLAIMLAAVVFSFDGARSRAQVLITAMDEYGNAMTRLHTDTGCYSQKLSSLLNKPTDAASGSTYCDATGANFVKSFSNWSGPYIKTITANAAGEIEVPSVAPTITLRSLRYKDNASKQVFYYIIADGVPIDVATAAYRSCNGGEPLDAAGNPLGDTPATADMIKLRCLPPNNGPWAGAGVTDVPAALPTPPAAPTNDTVSIGYLYAKGRF